MRMPRVICVRRWQRRGMWRALALALATAVSLSFSMTSAAAQIGLEVRGGAAIGNHRPAAAGLETHPGPSFAVMLDAGLHPRIAAWVGWSRSSFRCDSGFCSGETVTITSDGFSAGGRYRIHRFVHARAGLSWHNAVVDTDAGEFTTHRKFGVEIAAGGAVPLRPTTFLIADLGYRTHPGNDSGTALLTAQAGVRLEVGGAGRR